MKLLNCFSNKSDKNIFCREGSKKEVIPTLNRRIILPFYIPIISLISCLLLTSLRKKDSINKITIFIISFFILLFTELFIRYTGINQIVNYLFILFPFILLPSIYFILVKKFERELIYK